MKKIFLVGNPNVGKSVIFGRLTGAYTTVSNYPGTTVEVAKGEVRLGDETFQIIDSPGVNSLIPMSEDESVTRDLLLDNEGTVIQVADAKNLHRALPLSFQLKELEIPFILALNMTDEADRVGIKIDFKQLEFLLGVPVVPTCAVRGEGIAELQKRFFEIQSAGSPIPYATVLEGAIREIADLLPHSKKGKRALATMLLSGDQSVIARLRLELSLEAQTKIEQIWRQLSGSFSEPIGSLFYRERIRQADTLLKKVTTREVRSGRLWSWLSKITMHPIGGIFSLLVILEVVYLFVGKLGAGTLVDYFENTIFGKYISPAAIWGADKILPPDAHFIVKWFHDLLVGEYGLITMGLSYGFAIVLPIVTTFFIAFSIMEDSGYLPRLAVMMNRMFKCMGLNGKAVLPMVLGLGCDTMATLTTRILETRKQRIIVTLLLALAVPCSAQLGILLGMFGSMPVWTFWVWFSVIVGCIFFVGWGTNKILPGEGSDFVMEIPPLRLPQFANVAKKTLSRLEWYVKEAIPLFLLGTLLLFLLDSFHLLGWIQKGMSPLVVNFLGLPIEAANAFLIGFLRRDYGATGFFDMYSSGQLTVKQALVAMMVITLFIPCIANVFMMVKETGGRATARMVFFIFPFAFLVGGFLNWIL